MKYNSLGSSNIKVSELCLGSMTWGTQNTEQEAFEQIKHAINHGINFIDTAEMYAVPPSPSASTLTEIIIGNWLKQSKQREQLIIATKVSGPGLDWIRNGEGLTLKGIEQAITGSLERLNTDYIDLYQLHWPQRPINFFSVRDFTKAHSEHPVESTHFYDLLSLLQRYVDKGIIRAIGVSNESPWGLMKYIQHHQQDANLPKIESIQNPYSLMQREFDNHTSEVCIRENISMLAYSPLAGGILTGKYMDGSATKKSRFNDWGKDRYPHALAIAQGEALKEYANLAKQHEISLTTLALSFVRTRFFMGSAIFGATTLEQLKACIYSASYQPNKQLLDGIEKIHQKYTNPILR